MKAVLFIFSLLISVSACHVYTNYDDAYNYEGTQLTPKGMPNKPGACYAKCEMPDTYEIHREEYYLFTGDPENTEVEIRNVEVVISEGGKQWVKKKADKNCLSSDPEDCMVWCLVDTPREVENYSLVVDPKTTDEYELYTKETKELISKGGQIEWREVICEGNMSNSLITQVQNVLSTGGYYFGDIDGQMDKGVNLALRNYQIQNQLAIGHLTLESLDVMGVDY